MYRTRLDPPPANGWVPSTELLADLTRAESSEAAPPQEVSPPDDDFVLVAPEPPQPKLDFTPAPQTEKPQLLLVDGEHAEFVRKWKEGGKLLIKARAIPSGAEKTFTVPPAKVEIIDESHG